MTELTTAEKIAQLEWRLKAEPENLALWLALGHARQQRGDLQESLVAFERASKIAPTDLEALVNRGVLTKLLGRNEEAIALYRQALEIKPDSPEAHNNIGMALAAEGQHEMALAAFAEALRYRPTYARAEANQSASLYALDRLEDAAAAARRAIELEPTLSDGHLRLGLALMALNRQDEAVQSFRRQVESLPNDAIAISNLGVAVKESGRMGEALAIQAEAQAINPKEASPFWNEAHVRLLRGDFAVGWERYEARWGTPDFKSSLRPFAEPTWRGEPLGHRALLISLEQGVGDSIMFGRFVRTVAERNPLAELIVEVQPSLCQLFRHSFADLSRVLVMPNVNLGGVNLPPFDLHVPMATLAYYFAPRLETIPAPGIYLKPDGAPFDYRQPGDRLVIGISWHSVGATGRKRSLKLKQLASLLAQPGVRLVDLQYGDTSAERAELAKEGIALTHDDSVDAKRDLNAFARQVAACDLVVSIDNTTVHMAGALGVPTWVLLHYVPDWRWLLRREDTPWYSSLKLLRQPQLGNWQPVLERLAKDLAALVAGDQTVLKAQPWQGPPAQEP